VIQPSKRLLTPGHRVSPLNMHAWGVLTVFNARAGGLLERPGLGTQELAFSALPEFTRSHGNQSIDPKFLPKIFVSP
jgi:hypothetical protein